LLATAPRGDGHPVMVLPGFVTSDRSTTVLRAFLKGLGYDAHAWELGRNLGPKAIGQQGEKLIARILEVHEATGKKVSLVGWSLGGVMARLVAKRIPHAVRQVITLGSPFRLRPGDGTRADSIAKHLLRDQVPPDAEALIDEERRAPLPVPVTAIYTRTDGVAPWDAGIESRGPQRENIEVVGSHCGLGYNPAALVAVTDRLAQPEGRWQPFRPPAFTSHLFPTPVYWPTPTRQATAAI